MILISRDYSFLGPRNPIRMYVTGGARLEATTVSTTPHLKRSRAMWENPALHKIASHPFRERRRVFAASRGRVGGFD